MSFLFCIFSSYGSKRFNDVVFAVPKLILRYLSLVGGNPEQLRGIHDLIDHGFYKIKAMISLADLLSLPSSFISSRNSFF